MTPAALAELVRSLAHDVLASRGLDPTVLPAVVSVQRPRHPQHGDYVTNVALQTGRRAGVPPRELAGWLAQALAPRRELRSAEVAGPGFLNLRLAADAQAEIIALVLADGKRFGALANSGVPRLAALEELSSESGMAYPAQYAHARLAALARHAADLGITGDNAQLELLEHEREGELIRTLGEFPRVVKAAWGTAQRRQPRRLARYLERLTSTYHRFEETCRVLPMGDEQPSSRHAARLALCQATRQVLANGLGMLGLHAPERM